MRVALTAAMGLTAAVSLLAQGGSAGAKAELKDVQGKTVGDAVLTETPQGVIIRLNLTGVPEGIHALHVHEAGKCEPPFTTAGGHFNPSKKQHGMDNQMGMHAGDLPNIQVPAGGRLTLELFERDVTLGPGPNSLLDADGSSIVIHQGPDDYKTDPAGNAGARIACGVISR
jgi:superoxide dismutase, Cu-Zn family